jgi:hypothetical protein
MASLREQHAQHAADRARSKDCDSLRHNRSFAGCPRRPRPAGPGRSSKPSVQLDMPSYSFDCSPASHQERGSEDRGHHHDHFATRQQEGITTSGTQAYGTAPSSTTSSQDGTCRSTFAREIRVRDEEVAGFRSCVTRPLAGRIRRGHAQGTSVIWAPSCVPLASYLLRRARIAFL